MFLNLDFVFVFLFGPGSRNLRGILWLGVGLVFSATSRCHVCMDRFQAGMKASTF